MDVTEHEKTQLASFAETGYLLVKNAIPHSLCDSAVQEYEELIGRNAVLREHAAKYGRIPNAHTFSKSVKRIFTQSSEALRYQDLLFGYETSVYTCLYFKYGTQQPIHRDVPVFHTAPDNFYFGVWYALEDASIDNGALEAYPGGHRITTIDRYAMAARHTNDASSIHPSDSPLWGVYQNAVREECEAAGLKKVSLEMEKGDVLIWHPLLPHGGGKIFKEGRTRHSVVYHVVPRGCPVYKMDVFFNQAHEISPDLADWNYELFEGRLFADR